MSRPTFEDAKRLYVHRFTCEHVPNWASQQRECGGYYAPHYWTDWEWYANTEFPEGQNHCESRNQSWPFGQRLEAPFIQVAAMTIGDLTNRRTCGIM